MMAGEIPVIRAARPEDAAEACGVLRRSIIELCAADHDGDPARLTRWLANKTPDTVRGWIDRDGLLLAVQDDRIVGVGSGTVDGHITLMYVLPEARFQGVSKALLTALEAAARAGGNRTCTLESSRTAERFYRAMGYDGQPDTEGRLMLSRPLARPVD